MIRLRVKGKPFNINEEYIAKVSSITGKSDISCYSPNLNEGILISTRKSVHRNGSASKLVSDIADLSHLSIEDIVLISPNGSVKTLFRKNSLHNSLFITDRCNSNCLMCSQPPKNNDDLDYYYKINERLLYLIPKETPVLGITGGEPLLLGRRFIKLLNLINMTLPNTDIQILTNGRAFAWKNVSMSIGQINNSNFLFGIPLYSNYCQEHDYVVQAKNAFNQTMIGLHNMAKFDLRIEIRCVVHKQTYKRLPQLAEFIYKNLPFVEHIAFMGLEYTGYTPYNDNLLWIEPNEYSNELEEAVIYLDQMGMQVSIYNIQMCLLKKSLWGFARKSISDWKRNYLEECNKCILLERCGGVFSTSRKQSINIKAILD